MGKWELRGPGETAVVPGKRIAREALQLFCRGSRAALQLNLAFLWLLKQRSIRSISVEASQCDNR